MAFDVASQSPKAVEVVGSFLQAWTGVTTLSGGSASVTIPGCKKLVAVFASPQSSNAAFVTAAAAPSFTITGTGTDTVAWLAFGVGSI